MRTRNALVLAAFVALTASACRDDSPTGLAGTPRDGRVFIDNFIASDFQAFGGSKLDAVQLDTETKYRGSASLRVTIPAPGDPTGGYSGGAFVASAPRDLTDYDALTFYARASVAATLNVAGIGNDNTGNSLYTAERNAIPLTTAWTKVVIPIPLASRLMAEQGLFFFAEGAEGATGYTLWLDDIRYETLGTITNPRPTLAAATITTEVGATQNMTGLGVTFAVDGADIAVSAFPAYFNWTSSNTAVATVNASGRVTAVSAGSANITASLGTTAATGTVSLVTVAPPASAAPTPTYAAGDVISLFSNPYTNVAVNTWSADWDQADVADVTIGGNATKRYTNLTFAGIEFTGAPINATTMTHFRMDIWTPDAAAAPSAFKVKLVDFGANGTFGGGDDVEHELTFNATSTPALASGSWITLDIPFTQFTGLTTRAKLAQLIIVGDGSINTVYVDNVLLHR